MVCVCVGQPGINARVSRQLPMASRSVRRERMYRAKLAVQPAGVEPARDSVAVPEVAYRWPTAAEKPRSIPHKHGVTLERTADGTG